MMKKEPLEVLTWKGLEISLRYEKDYKNNGPYWISNIYSAGGHSVGVEWYARDRKNVLVGPKKWIARYLNKHIDENYVRLRDTWLYGSPIQAKNARA
jgi:hypothetical protein